MLTITLPTNDTLFTKKCRLKSTCCAMAFLHKVTTAANGLASSHNRICIGSACGHIIFTCGIPCNSSNRNSCSIGVAERKFYLQSVEPVPINQQWRSGGMNNRTADGGIHPPIRTPFYKSRFLQHHNSRNSVIGSHYLSAVVRLQINPLSLDSVTPP